jgi:hypothetical protein
MQALTKSGSMKHSVCISADIRVAIYALYFIHFCTWSFIRYIRYQGPLIWCLTFSPYKRRTNLLSLHLSEAAHLNKLLAFAMNFSVRSRPITINQQSLE